MLASTSADACVAYSYVGEERFQCLAKLPTNGGYTNTAVAINCNNQVRV